MYTKILGAYLYEAYKKDLIDDYQSIDYSLRREKTEETENEFAKLQSFDLSTLKENNLIKLLNLLEKKEDTSTSVKSIKKWIELLKDPVNSKITSMTSFESLFKKLVEKQKTNIFFFQESDGSFLPFLLVDSRKKSDEDGSFVCLEFKYKRISFRGKYDDDDSEVSSKLENINKSIYINKYDLLSDFSISNLEDENIEKLTLIEILSKKNILPYNEDYMQIYKNELENFFNLKNKVGKQFKAKGECLVKQGWWFWSDTKFLPINSLVIIEKMNQEIDNYIIKSEKTIKTSKEQIPIHPYLKCYDLIDHKYILIIPSSLEEYEYNTNLIDQLIIKDEIKFVISKIVGNDIEYEDIIIGKSRGKVLLSTGDPGLGKTLTAEIYAETLQKPLYKIQASQLGIRAEDVEKKLKTILINAYRWNCVLLIDEADTYVSKRSDDINKNCITGVFLRLLEYYSGILFLTTNRSSDIDDAILSRCNLIINYDYPTKDQAIKIFEILSSKNKIEIDKKVLNKIIDSFVKEGSLKLSGRTIGNIVKNLKKFSNNEKIDFSIFERIQNFLYLK